jgi:lysozyme family protein
MQQDFGLVMPHLYTAEGGFSNDPRDPGGMTNLGVTAREWAAWKGIPLSLVSAKMMQGLTQADTDPLYRQRYWNMVDGDFLPAGVDALLMHFEVNAGAVAATELQALVAVKQDGVIGPRTLAALATYTGYVGTKTALQAIGNAQAAHYRTLAQFSIYGKGWLNRVNSFLALAFQMAGVNEAPAPV